MDEANESEIEYLSTSQKISEEDNEDYNIDETDDEENNDNYNEDEDEDEDIDDIMQVDIEEGLSKEIIEGLKLLHLKSLYNFTEAAYNDIIKLFTNENISLYTALH